MYPKYVADKIAYAISAVEMRNSTPRPGFKSSPRGARIAMQWLTEQVTRQTCLITRDVTGLFDPPIEPQSRRRTA